MPQIKESKEQMRTHTDTEKRIDPFSYNTLHFKVWPFVTIVINSCLSDKIYENLLFVSGEYHMYQFILLYSCDYLKKISIKIKRGD